MRSFLAGLILLLISTSSALAQIKGEVESIGFGNTYRPDCWTPMIVRFAPEDAKTDTYTLQVRQKDLDGDIAAYSRPISLTAGEGASKGQRFLTAFLPQPNGLMDRTAGGSVAELDKDIGVFLLGKSGKELARLHVTSPLDNIDPKPGSFSNRRGTKLILAVTDGRSQPSWSEYANEFTTPGSLLGVLEDVQMVPLGTRDLPENPLAYDSVDAILWTNVDPAELKRGGDAKFRALETYVRNGGKLVICQSSEWQKFNEFGDLLPVDLQGVADKADLFPLRKIANQEQKTVIGRDEKTKRDVERPNPWAAPAGPFKLARAKTRTDTKVDEWIDWSGDGKDRTPYLVRRPFGMGCVTWVAQDLGDPAITSLVKTGWVVVWDKVFDWKNAPLVVTSRTAESDRSPYSRPASGINIAQTTIGGMDLSSTVSWLVTIAIAFFIVYWVFAGPGVYAYLAAHRRTAISWFLFAASAIAATAVTMLIVKLVVRGPPELKHTSVVRAAPNLPGVIKSRFGLYIKQDGDQRIALKETAAGQLSTISAFPLHPAYVTGDAAPSASLEYVVPVRDLTTDDAPAITVPYRSTLKKFEASWTGDLPQRIEGAGKLLTDTARFIEGTLTNNTGNKLRNIYLVFNYNNPVANAANINVDWILYLPSWEPGVSIDLAKAWTQDDKGERTALLGLGDVVPDGRRRVKGKLIQDWELRFWGDAVRKSSGMTGDGTLKEGNFPMALPMLSVFDRLAPLPNTKRGETDRAEILRRGARKYDMSAAVAAGQLLLLAECDGPLPVPLEVEGKKITGDGKIFYQFVLPLDRTQLEAAKPPEDH